MSKSIYRAQFSKLKGKEAKVEGDIGVLGFDWNIGPYLLLLNPDTGSPTRNIYPGEEVVIDGERYQYVEVDPAAKRGGNGPQQDDSPSLF